MSTSTKSSHKKAPHPKKNEAASESFGNLLQSALFGALCGIITATILLFAATAICYATADPCSLTTPIGLIVLYLSSAIAGFAAIRRHRSMALVCGSFSGLFLMLVFVFLSFLLRNHAEPNFTPSLSLLLRALMIPIAAIGGSLGLSRKAPKKRHAHR